MLITKEEQVLVQLSHLLGPPKWSAGKCVECGKEQKSIKLAERLYLGTLIYHRTCQDQARACSSMQMSGENGSPYIISRCPRDAHAAAVATNAARYLNHYCTFWIRRSKEYGPFCISMIRCKSSTRIAVQFWRALDMANPLRELGDMGQILGMSSISRLLRLSTHAVHWVGGIYLGTRLPDPSRTNIERLNRVGVQPQAANAQPQARGSTEP